MYLSSSRLNDFWWTKRGDQGLRGTNRVRKCLRPGERMATVFCSLSISPRLSLTDWRVGPQARLTVVATHRVSQRKK